MDEVNGRKKNLADLTLHTSLQI